MASAQDILARIKDEEIEWIDLRFTDPKGKWQHLTMVSSVIGEDEGIHAYHHAVVRRVAEGAGVRALRIPAGARWQEIDRPEDIAHWQAS